MTDDTMTDEMLLAAEIEGLGFTPEWLCSQLEAWPNQIDPARPTNAEHLMDSAAKLLRTLLARPAPVTPYKVPTGDFRCHNCKDEVKDLVVAPRRCGKCGCRDFAAIPPAHIQKLIGQAA